MEWIQNLKEGLTKKMKNGTVKILTRRSRLVDCGPSSRLYLSKLLKSWQSKPALFQVSDMLLKRSIIILILFHCLLIAGIKIANAETVRATFYTKASLLREGSNGTWTASGERFNENAQTCAHRTYPFGTLLKVRNPRNGTWYECRVNDRGPAKWTGNGIDLTPKGFRLLRMKGAGMVEVTEVKS